jgi:dienelactone hydrolase
MAITDLAGYDVTPFDAGGRVHPVYRRGSGPAVIVIHEMPNLHPLVVRFADRVAQAGMTVFLPSLFGTAGRTPTPAYTKGQFVKVMCVRREFNIWRGGRSSAIVDWLRALARHAHAECGRNGVGALGMCFTGGFALAMMTEPAVVAPVLSQPSLPFGKNNAAALDATAEEVSCARGRFEQEGLSMIGLRFHGDGYVPPERFARLKTEFGEHFEVIELHPEHALAGTGSDPHSVLTTHLVDEPGTPTKRAEERVIAFLAHAVGA